ncbi:hypothetical protein G8A07_10900 [Roseateles sp. DAIF2]|uniref:hypothetical protein n=1 Tax=Roseateles sp. DAIF2 TaxID=2714952 RepID=UPI0018A31A75|nr:hypothetical protein [Roseateles sp. DAIF2]QPF73375.1 hypothetical protein G8A07_10900 [Roseateles sp. DAIF2]
MVELENLASLGVLVANLVFVVIAIAAYLRMNAQEDERRQYLSHALHDSREAGLALKGVARDLQRLLERSGSGTARGAERHPAAMPLDAASIGEDSMDFARLSPPEHPPEPDDYDDWRRHQQVELARLLQQRRQLQQALDGARAQAARREPHPALTDQLQQLRQQVNELQAQLQRSRVEKEFIEERLLALDAAQRRAARAEAEASIEA